MSLTVRGPVQAMSSLRASEQGFERGISRISSGQRIRSAADDAAGLAISQGLFSRVRGSAIATRNVSDGIGMLQTAEGGLEAITSMLQRARDLAVQGASTGSMSASAREAIAAEALQLVGEIDRTARSTGSYGLHLLDGSRPAGFALQVGADSGSTFTVAGHDVRASTLGLLGSAGAPATTVTSVTSTSTTTYTSESALFSSYTQSKTAGGGRNFHFLVDGVIVQSVKVAAGTYDAEGLAAAFRTGLGTGSALTVSTVHEGGRGRVVVGLADRTSTSTVDVGGADADIAPLSFANIATTTTVEQETTTTLAAVPPSSGLVDLLMTGSQDAIALVDQALETVLGARSNVGAAQNRLEHRLSLLANTGENLAAARSRIADADVAHEMMGVVRAQVLTQAASSLQAQGAASGQRVLQLLSSL